MTQEDKELLLKDICARLLYGVKVTTTNPAVELGVISGISIENKISVRNKHADIVFNYTEVKPYLRPMSSMTDKEKEELNNVTVINCNEFEGCSTLFDETGFDWLNSHHFDYRGLIEKGLALVATDDMYKINKE